MSYFGNSVINWALRSTNMPSAPAPWLGLVTDNGEPAGNGYARINVTGLFSPPDATDTTCNLSLITFATALADWGRVVGVAFFDAETGGNTLFGGAVAQPFDVPAQATVYWQQGALKVGITPRS